MTLHTAIASVRLVLGLLVLVAIGTQLSIHVGLNYSVLNFFSYFTNLSNALAALVFLLSALKYFAGGHSSPGTDRLRFMAAINMVIVGVVFAILLRNVDLGSLRPWINTLLHYVMPVVVLADWILDPPRTKLATPDLARVLVFPVLYLGYTLVRGNSVQWYPYPFLNPANVGGYGNVALYSAAITITFIGTGFALIVIRNRRARPTQ